MFVSPFKNIYPLKCYSILPFEQLKSILGNSALSSSPLTAKSSKCVLVASFPWVYGLRQGLNT